MKVKICGMKYPENIGQVALLKPDFLGFILYPQSSRYVDLVSIKDRLDGIDGKVKRVAVFVNEGIEKLVNTCTRYGLDYVQLHGDETPEYVAEVNNQGIGVIKAFSVSNSFDWNILGAYTASAQYFLFDTAGSTRGGTGKKFNWGLLRKYKEDRPFFLSGGIGPSDIEAIKNLQIPQLEGIDANSRLELKPGLKDVERVKKLLNQVKNVR